MLIVIVNSKIHTIAKEFVPPDQAVKATTIWAAVLKPGRLDDLNGLSTEDFLWFKCKGVRQHCQQVSHNGCSRDDVQLKSSCSLLRLGKSVKSRLAG